MERVYLKTYNWVVNLLQDCDFSESSRRLELRQIAQNKTFMDFLGRTYSISKDGIELVEQQFAWTYKTEEYDYNLKSVLGYYLLSEADVEPENDFCTLEHFSNGVFRGNSFGNILGRVYGSDYKKFYQAAEEIGMVFEAEKASGQYIWKCPKYQ